MHQLFVRDALLETGWQRDVLIGIEGRTIASIEAGVAPPAGAERLAGAAVPGIANVHSHAFQRAMAGLAERRGPDDDDFWTWREVMYRFALRVSPDDIEAIAAQLFTELLEAGFTRIGEFHYLHHDLDGTPYANLAETGMRIAAAAAETGIGLTLIPTFYAHGGFGGAPPSAQQRRFINDLDRFGKVFAASSAANGSSACPATAAVSGWPRAAAICCPAASASHDMRLKAPLRCSSSTRTPLI